jgi:hypothetical protein
MLDAEADLFKQSALDSFTLALEIFNRPHETGRINTTLILMDHSFEALLKASILKQGGVIRDNPDDNTIGFSACVNIAVNGQHDEPDIDFVEASDATVLRTINQLRDAAQHEYIGLSEHQLYLHARQAVELFDTILTNVFNESVSDTLPERVLPLSTRFPIDILTAINNDYKHVEELLEAGDTDVARARLRAIESLERALNNDDTPPSKDELDKKLDSIQEGTDVTKIFPGIVAVDSESGTEPSIEGPATSVQIGDEGPLVRYASDEDLEGDEDVNLFREVNPHDRYNLDFFKTANRLNDRLDMELSWMRVKAVMKEIGLLDDPEYFKELSTGGTGTRKAVHPRTLDRLEEAIITDEVDVEDAWEKHKSELFGYD